MVKNEKLKKTFDVRKASKKKYYLKRASKLNYIKKQIFDSYLVQIH